MSCGAYKDEIDTEEFFISYIKHEAQHLSDYKRFPGLEQMQLEYRAKLIELIYFSNHSFLETLISTSFNNQNSPHSYAGYLITKRLSVHFFNKEWEDDLQRWAEIDYAKISQFAVILYEEHTKNLTAGKVNCHHS